MVHDDAVLALGFSRDNELLVSGLGGCWVLLMGVGGGLERVAFRAATTSCWCRVGGGACLMGGFHF